MAEGGAPIEVKHYVLRCEPGHYALIKADAALAVTLFADRLRELTREAIGSRRTIEVAEHEAITRRERELDAAIVELRGIARRLTRLGGTEGAALAEIASAVGRAGDAVVAAALALGFHHRGEARVVAEEERRIMAEAGQGQTANACKANRERREKAVLIVMRLAGKHWVLKPTDRSSPYRTAKAIAKDVWVEVQKMPVPPRGWAYESDAQYADMLRQVIPRAGIVDA